MKSSLAHAILATMVGYFIILLLFQIHEWIQTNYPRPTANPENINQIQHPYYHDQAVDSLKRFLSLSKSEKSEIKSNLESNLISMKRWQNLLDRLDYEIICIGELHDESTRDFLADNFFADFDTSVLLLETTPDQLNVLIKRMNSGRFYFPLLTADIMGILRTVSRRNASVQIYGIEETSQQQREQSTESSSRDKSIALNFWKSYQPGMRHIVLFGALHCAKEQHWLYQNLMDQATFPLKNRMLSVFVLGEHQNGPLEAFLFFLDELGIDKESFAIPWPNRLHPRILELFQSLNKQVLEKYDTLVVYRS
jgi:hypothetical protein